MGGWVWEFLGLAWHCAGCLVVFGWGASCFLIQAGLVLFAMLVWGVLRCALRGSGFRFWLLVFVIWVLMV